MCLKSQNLIFSSVKDQLDLVRVVLGHTRTDMTRRYQGLNLEKIKEMGE